MLDLWDELFCQLFHWRWTSTVSYSRRGNARCFKLGCRAQRRSDARGAHLRGQSQPA